MCFLKNVTKPEEKIDFDDFFSKHEDPSDAPSESEENVLIPCEEKQENLLWSQEQQKLINLFELIEKNTHIIDSISKTLENNFERESFTSSKIIESNSFETECLGKRDEESFFQ